MLVEKAGGSLWILCAQFGQVRPHVGEHGDHAGHDFPGIGALQATLRAADDLSLDQLVRDLLRAAKAGLEQVTPAAGRRAHPAPGPVADEDRVPLAGDELLPPEFFDLLRIVVVHTPNSTVA